MRYFRHYDKNTLRNRSFLSMTELILSSCACFHEKNLHFQLIFVEALSKIVYNGFGTGGVCDFTR